MNFKNFKFSRLKSKSSSLAARKNIETSVSSSDINQTNAALGLLPVAPKSFLPTTSSSLSLENLKYILNDIVLNQRSSILEFGSGLSTIYIANLIKTNQLDCDFCSIDENKDWINLVSQILQKELVDDCVNLVYAPLENNSENMSESDWYSLNSIDQAIEPTLRFDCAIIDGPTAFLKGTELRRRYAGTFLANRLCGSASIFLDDIDRQGEKAIYEAWRENYGWNFHELSKTMGVFVIGESMNIK